MQAYKNEIMLGKVISAVQARLVKLEASELELLSKESQDEAVKLALVLSKYPAPPMPEFEMDEKYQDAEKIADLVDDIFSSTSSGNSNSRQDDFFDNYGSGESTSSKEEEKLSITDAEATKQCQEWKTQYDVAVGVSWGNLPHDLQQQWLKYSCDYHLA